MFASLDPGVARAKGVPVSALTIVFMLTLGLAVALSVQVVGVLLVLALLITPAAAATQLSASPVWVPVLSVIFAVTASVGGILIALGSPVVPISPFVTTISFLIYLVCRLVGSRRMKALDRRRVARAASACGTLLSLGSPSVPISPFVTTISFLSYRVFRLVGSRRMKALDRRRVARAAEEHNTSLAAA